MFTEGDGPGPRQCNPLTDWPLSGITLFRYLKGNDPAHKDIEKLEFFTHDPISLNAPIDLFLKRKLRHHDVNFENLLHN